MDVDAPPAAPPRWQLAREVPTPEGPALRWELRRHCALTPRQMMAMYALTTTLSLLIGAAFVAAGLPLVIVFSVVEMTALAAALLVHARHACDCDTVVLDRLGLAVEQRCGNAVRQHRLQAAWTGIERPRAQGEPVRLRQGAVIVSVGTYIRPALRDVVAQELQRALRQGWPDAVPGAR